MSIQGAPGEPGDKAELGPERMPPGPTQRPGRRPQGPRDPDEAGDCLPEVGVDRSPEARATPADQACPVMKQGPQGTGCAAGVWV